tara:strand:+ start:1498 stop:1917 length:420 start_codon:yes stop_codon:yes gene_type:complete
VSVRGPGGYFPVISSPGQASDRGRGRFCRRRRRRFRFLLLLRRAPGGGGVWQRVVMVVLFFEIVARSIVTAFVRRELSDHASRIEAPQNDRPFRRPGGENVSAPIPVVVVVIRVRSMRERKKDVVREKKEKHQQKRVVV